MIGEFCLVRANDAAVHSGVIGGINGRTVLIHNARKLWRWGGANTLNEVALYGASEDYTRISEPVAKVLVLDACEVIICTDVARKNLEKSRWAQ